MKNTYEVRAQNFIKQIFPYLISCRKYRDYEFAVWAFNMKFNRKVIFQHGLTRIAFITSDYVIKMNFHESAAELFGDCESEIALYNEAEQDGFEYLFAKISRYEYRNTTFYIMPRISEINKTYNEAWDYMTDEECDWCCNHCLGDLHCSNYGWKNGHIVIIDYAAWGE